MIKMTGVLRVKRRSGDGKISLMTFVDIHDDESFKVAKSCKWDELCNYEFALIEAWGQIYYEYNEKMNGRFKVFNIKEFVISSGCSGNFEIDSLIDDGQSFGSRDLMVLAKEESA